MATDHLVGHGFAKVDRATAEQAVEMRCPLLDWDVMSYARSLPFESLAQAGRSKALLKAQLSGWPEWFLERPKLGFALNLRWLWSLSNFSGLRESIEPEATAMFDRWLPAGLRGEARCWKTRGILKNFQPAWRLLTWSCFLRRVRAARSANQ